MTNADFNAWESRWAEGRIGFHRDAINPHLMAHFDALQRQPGQSIAVPLCGKSLDLIWLAEKGYQVTGVEMVPQAIEDFFTAWGKTPKTTQIDGMPCHQFENIRLINGNIFDVPSVLFDQFDAIYDRAAFVALRPQQRQRYAETLKRLIKPNGKVLLLTYETPTDPNDGPPYSMNDQAVYDAFPKCRTSLLNTIQHSQETEPKLKKHGIEWSIEKIWLVEFT